MNKRKIYSLVFCCFAYSGLFAESLPTGLVWQTNDQEPVYTSEQAKKGGVYRTYILSYPLTFRLYGPNSNAGGFVSVNRDYALFSLTGLHPNTLQIIPKLATHWAVMKDQQTVYYKLDKDARWSDGHPITADDYLFAHQFLQSEHIKAPFYNQYMRDNFSSVTKIDTHTIKIVGTKPSWRILATLSLSPVPKHATLLNKDWVKTAQWQPNVVPGPYVINPDKTKKGRKVVFERVKNWWGEDKRYFKNMYNFDQIVLEVVRNAEVAYELFKKQELNVFTPSEVQWSKKSDFSAVNKGYIKKQKLYTDVWSGMRGLFFSTQQKPWDNKKLRQAVAHTLDFETINKNLLYSLSVRKHHFFDVLAPYKVKDQRTYAFDIQKAADLIASEGFQRGADGIFQKNGQPLSLTTVYGSDSMKPHLAYWQQTAKQAGIKLNLQKLDGAAFFEGINNHDFQSFVLSFGSGRYPGPRQMLHSENLKKGTNNVTMFADPKIDEWIEIYEFDLDEAKRVQAIKNIEQMVHENAIVVPFWKKNFALLMWWHSIQGPEKFITKIGFNRNILWYSDEAQTDLDQAKQADQALPVLPLEADPNQVLQ